MKQKNSAFSYWASVFEDWENRISEKMEDLLKQAEWNDTMKATLRQTASFQLIKTYDNLSFTQDSDVLQKYVKNGQTMYLCNPNEHYKYYKKFYEGDEVKLLSAANFRQSTINFYKDYYPDKTIEKIRIWSNSSDSAAKKNLTYIILK